MSEYRAGSHNTLRYTPFLTEPTALATADVNPPTLTSVSNI
jgi:hypothetical protein